MNIADFRFQISICQPDPRPLSPVPCLLSPVPCPLTPVPCPLTPDPCPLTPDPCPLSPRLRRKGVSIIEVLFSILVTTVGLFGAIAVFPVASSQARRARTNDSVAAAGRWAVHNIDAMGMRRPDRWLTWQTSPQYRLVNVPFDRTNENHRVISWCIDSRFLMQPGNVGKPAANVFPYNSNYNTFNGAGQVNTVGQYPRMNRIAFVGALPYFGGNPQPTVNGNKLLADSIFQFDDDLAFARPGLDENVINPASPTNATIPNDRSLPAIQLFDRQISGGNATLIKRQSQGHLSWLATLVPKIDLALFAGSDEYTLSIVVFEDRPLTDNPTNPTSSLDDIGERVANVQLFDDGSTGGEVRLTVPNINATDSPARLKLRANDWIMLACNVNYPTLNPTYAINRFQWYRVTHCDPEPVLDSTGNFYELYATLIGPDWNWPAGSSNPMAILMPGVLAVHEKTIRLDYGSSY